MIAELQVLPTPAGTDENEFEHVEAAIAVIASSGLKHTVNALGTTIEGSPDEVWATARAAFDACLESGATKEMMILKIYQSSHTTASLEKSGRAAAAAATAAKPAARAAAVDPSDAKGRLIHTGSRELPPLVEVPCAATSAIPLEKIVKPPDADVLWQWEESRGNTEADPSWASVWPAAACLAGVVAADPKLVEGRRVAELGAGLGIAGLTAAKLGATTVTLIDREALALHCAMSTAAICGLATGPVPDGSDDARAFYNALGDDGTSSVVSASMMDWGVVADNGLCVDVVLASEVLYDPREATSLAACVSKMLGAGGTLLLTDPAAGRVPGARAEMKTALREFGAVVTEEPLQSPGGVEAAEAVVLLRAEFGNDGR